MCNSQILLLLFSDVVLETNVLVLWCLEDKNKVSFLSWDKDYGLDKKVLRISRLFVNIFMVDIKPTILFCLPVCYALSSMNFILFLSQFYVLCLEPKEFSLLNLIH